MKSLFVKKGDTVKIITGKDSGKSGKITRVFPKKNQVLIDGLNLFKKHQRRTKDTKKGEIVERPFPVHASNVQKVK